jgi:predicted porin
MDDLGGISGRDRKAWGVGAGFKMANNLLKLHYYSTDKQDGQATENGANLWALGVDHSLSKTTIVYANYATVSNDGGTTAFNVSSANGGHGATNVPTVGKAGGDGKAYSFGTIIKF